MMATDLDPGASRLAFLEGLIGKPYRIGARGPDAFDCYGLARFIQIEIASVDMPDVVFYEASTRSQAEAMLKHPERENWDEIQEIDAHEFDLVLMGNVAKRDFHLGTLVAPSTVPVVIHTNSNSGVVVHDVPALRAIGFNYLKFYRRKV